MSSSRPRTPVTGESGSGSGRIPALHEVVTVLVTTACASCHGVFPIDALVDTCVCPTCKTQLALPPERWREVLTPLLSRIESLPSDGKLERTTGSFQFAAHRPAGCSQCNAPLPTEVFDQAESGQTFCPACGFRMATRPVPPALASMLPGVTHLIGEDPDTVANPLEARPSAGHGFLLRIDRALRNQYFPPDWGEVLAATCDAAGNVYLLCTETARFGQLRALALDTELRTLWSRPGLPMGKHQDRGITVTTDGVVVWTGDRVSAVKLAFDDGRELGRVGGQQPRGADRHFMDLDGAVSMVADVDGTYLLMKERRLVRCGGDGNGVATWPPRRGFFGKKHEKLVAFGEDDGHDAMAPMIEKVPDHPTYIYRATIRVGWDQRVYLASSSHLACVERDGKVKWRASLPEGWYVDYGADVHGQLYALSGKDLPGIWRISPDGRQGTLVVDGRSHETPLAESAMVVRPDGAILTFAERGQIRMFSPTGALHWRTDSARLADEKRAAHQTAAAYGTGGDV